MKLVVKIVCLVVILKLTSKMGLFDKEILCSIFKIAFLLWITIGRINP